jgi:hypothetical protein
VNDLIKSYLQPYLLAGILAALLALGGSFWYYGHTQYSKGLSVARAEAVLQVAAEREAERVRQTQANTLAQQQAKADLDRLLLNGALLTQTLKDNADAALNDPSASRECLSADGVRRLNAIR